MSDEPKITVMKKKNMNFKSIDSLKSIENVLNETSEALKDSSRTIANSAIPDVLGGAIGAAIGGTVSFGILYGAGTVGLSAAGITSGLATAGGIVGGGMVAGIFVLAAPVAVLGIAGTLCVKRIKDKQLKQEKERLYQEALRKQSAIVNKLRSEASASKERADYLNALNILLRQAIKDLKADLAA